MQLKNKKILLVGLGIQGGGFSAAKYFISRGAKLTITDLRKKEELKEMIAKLKKIDPSIKYTIGEHKESDFKNADVIVFNPAVPATSPWVAFAAKLGKPYFNDYTFFLNEISSRKSDQKPIIIGITGTRGKTTITNWTHYLIPGSAMGGNVLNKNLYEMLKSKAKVLVLELSSFQLEFDKTSKYSPNIAILTNVYVDHLNRYKSLNEYKKIKLSIFRNQTEDDALILNLDEEVTKEALAKKPKSNLFFVSKKQLPKDKNGMYFKGDDINYQFEGKVSKVTKFPGLAPHEKTNLLSAMLTAHVMGIDGKEIVSRIKSLPTPDYRQQEVFNNKKIKIINDSAGTSPDATIAAIEKFKSEKNFILISGGTNKELDYQNLAKKIAIDVKPENLFLLAGSGTNLLLKELSKIVKEEIVPYDNLEDIVDIVSQEFTTGAIVFSPGGASFEKFKNEYDRGAKFNSLAKKYFS